MPKTIIITLFFFLLTSCSSQFTHDYESVRVDEIMENMEEPEWAIDRMFKNDMHQHPDLAKMIDRLSLETDNLITINHPDKAFNNFTNDLKLSLIEFKKSTHQSKGQLSQQWQQVKNSCRNCHEIYE
jgi:hypothetical protein